MTGPCCPQCRDLVPELALGALTGRERANMIAHVGACPPCREYLAALACLYNDLLLLVPPVEPPAGYTTRVLAAVGLRPEPGWPPSLPHSRPTVVIAVLAAVALSGGAWAWARAVNPGRSAGRAVPGGAAPWAAASTVDAHPPIGAGDSGLATGRR